MNKIIIYQSELDYLSRCILECPNIETGGNLFGLSTPFGIPVILYAVGPGRDAIHEEFHFRQDYRFLDENADLLVAEHALHHIGSWHSHHSLELSQPSIGDATSTVEGIKECGLKSFLLIIGNYRGGKSTIRPFKFYKDGSSEELCWVILPDISPIRSCYDSQHPDMVYKPSGTANMADLNVGRLIDRNVVNNNIQPTFDNGYWLASQENRKALAAILKHLKSRYENVRLFQTGPSKVGVEFVSADKLFRINFDESFPNTPPVFMTTQGQYLKFRKKPVWSYSEYKNLSEEVINLIDLIEI